MGKFRHDSGSDDENTVEKTYTKGPWTQAEDNLLIAYVDEHGEGNWNAVQKHSGLSRCGKSCRLRWVNHLRPDLKKGSFTEKEEKRVIHLHALMGNKWARMAAELPGRTDNEIKNFWNTRVKRLQRYGLPLYPEDIREKAMNAAAQYGLTTDSLDVHHSKESLETDTMEIPQLDFEHLPLNQSSSYFQSMLQNVPTTSGIMNPCFVQPNMYNLIASPNMPSRKRPREPETTFPFTGEYARNEESPPLWNYTCAVSTPQQLADNHLLGNTTYSSPSGPLILGVEKLELPSFQCFDSHKEPGNIMPDLELDNTLVRSPLTDQTLSDCTSSGYDGLLESVVYGSSRQREEPDTDSDSILFQCSLLGHTELTQTSANTLDLTSSNERHTSFDGDYIKLLLGEDRDNTKQDKFL